MPNCLKSLPIRLKISQPTPKGLRFATWWICMDMSHANWGWTLSQDELVKMEQKTWPWRAHETISHLHNIFEVASFCTFLSTKPLNQQLCSKKKIMPFPGAYQKEVGIAKACGSQWDVDEKQSLPWILFTTFGSIAVWNLTVSSWTVMRIEHENPPSRPQTEAHWFFWCMFHNHVKSAANRVFFLLLSCRALCIFSATLGLTLQN